MENTSMALSNEVLTSIDTTSILKQLFEQQRVVSIYLDNQRYFIFLFKNKTYCISEFKLCFMAASLSFFTVIGIRLINRRFNLKKKTKRFFKKSKNKTVDLIKKLRGGNVDQGVCYEPSLDEFFDSDFITFTDLVLAGFQNERLSNKDLYVKQIIKKCIKSGTAYRIVNPKLVSVIESMIKFKSRENIKSVSAEVFTLALVISTSGPSRDLMFQGLNFFGEKFIPSFILMNGPLIIAILTGGIVASQIPINGILSILKHYLTILPPVYYTSFAIAASIRAQFFLDCSDYVQKLPTTEIVKVLPSPDITNLNTQKSLTTTEHYTREKPVKQDIFIIPNQENLNYQKELKLETLDGVIKRQQTVDGQLFIGWSRNKELKSTLDKAQYMKLETRTKHWCDVAKHDSTESRNSATNIIKSVSKERFLDEVLEQSME